MLQVNGTGTAAKTGPGTKKKTKSPPKLQRYQPVVDSIVFPKPKRTSKKSSAAAPAKRIPSVSTPCSIQPILEPPRKKRPAKTQPTPAKKPKVTFIEQFLIYTQFILKLSFFNFNILNFICLLRSRNPPRRIMMNFSTGTLQTTGSSTTF